MSEAGIKNNVEVYNAPSVAAYYASLNYLTPCERLLFETHIANGSVILDLGVGGGRTTPFLSNRASRYIGLDYSSSMVEQCRTKFPGLQFQVGNAADLSSFPDAEFDAVVFAYNGIDFVLPEAARRRCLTQIFRILKPGGVLIFSSHNARAIFIRSSWNRGRLRRIAHRIAPNSKVIRSLLLAGLTLIRRALAVGQACVTTLLRLIRRLPTRTFWSGDGCRMDSAHGGLFTHYCIPSRVVHEAASVSLRVVRALGDDYPRTSHPLVTDWYYYVFIKTS